MGLLNYIKSFEEENNENVIVNTDEDIDDDIMDLELEEFFENDNEAYENLLDIIVDKAKDIFENKYTIEDLLKIEPDLNKYISSDLSQEDAYVNIYNKVETIKFENILKSLDNICYKLDINNEISFEELLSFSLEEDKEKNKSKFNEMLEKLENKFKEVASRISIIEAVFGASVLYQLKEFIKIYKKSGFTAAITPDVFPEPVRGSIALGIIKSRLTNPMMYLFYALGISFTYRTVKYNHKVHVEKLSKMSKNDFNLNKKVRLLSKDKLDSNIKIFDKLMKSSNKLITEENITSVEQMKSELKSIGIDITKRGIGGEDKIRSIKTLPQHGYGPGDFEKYKNKHSEMLTQVRNFIESILKGSSWNKFGKIPIKSDAKKKFDKKALKLLSKAIRQSSRRIMMDTYLVARSIRKG